jgi:hypothetical protein
MIDDVQVGERDNGRSWFVGRAEQLEQLFDAARSATRGSGATVFIAGDLGSGKQTLLDEFETRIRRDGDLSDLFFAKGVCDRTHDADNAYEPFAGLLLDLVAENREGKLWDAIFKAVKQVAPDWLGVVPIAGPAIQAGVKTALRAQELYAAEAEEERAKRAQSRHLQFLAALELRLRDAQLVVLVISQAQWIDTASAALLDRVARAAVEKPVLILVSYRPADLGEGHPLRSVERALRIDDLAMTIALTGLDATAIARWTRASRGLGLMPEVAEWLVAFTEGNPLFVTQLIPALEHRGILIERNGAYAFHDDASVEDGALRLIGTLAGSEIPRRVSDALDERIERVEKSLRNLLGIAAVEGAQFLTATLARVAQADDAALLDQLDEAEKRYGIVRYAEALQRHLFRYEFAHLLLHQRIYELLPEPKRLDFHAQVADALVETWGADAPRPVLLDIARHYETGLDRKAAAQFLLKAAESAQVDGASPHAASLTRRALTLLDEAARDPRPSDTDGLRAELIAVLIAAKWEDVQNGESTIEALIEDGKAAAERAGDAALRARLLHAEARYVLGTRSVPAAIAALEQARQLARAAGDPISELTVTIDLGNTMNVQELKRGLDTLREALTLYEVKLAPLVAEHSELSRLHGRLLAYVGIGEFDNGNLGEAKRLLDASILQLEAARRTEDFPRILNYRAQIALGEGDFAAAEADVRRALEAEGRIAGPWASYNRALLGKIFLDSGRMQEAAEEIRAAWRDAQAAWQLRLGLVVRQYLLELLLRADSSDAELKEADALVMAQRSDAEASGFKNMLVGAHSLKAELELRRDRPLDAVKESEHAVKLLEAAGELPILRSEEVYWRHSRCLALAGKSGADIYAQKARAIVQRKAASLEDDELGQRLLSSTPVARALSASS